MSVEQSGLSDTSDTSEGDESGDEWFVRRPKIEMEGADSYYTPRELFAKRLINTPIQFGTQTIRRDFDDGDPGTRASRVYEVDVAVHPHRGAVVCGMTTGLSGDEPEDRIAAGVERLEEGRRVLVEAADDYTWSGWSPPPVGLFVVAPDMNRRDIPAGWNEGRAWVCPSDEPETMHVEMVEAMKSMAGRHGIEDFQRMAAVVRSMGAYTSGLAWLLEFEAV